LEADLNLRSLPGWGGSTVFLWYHGLTAHRNTGTT
jgi:hypothetical protein